MEREGQDGCGAGQGTVLGVTLSVSGPSLVPLEKCPGVSGRSAEPVCGPPETGKRFPGSSKHGLLQSCQDQQASTNTLTITLLFIKHPTSTNTLTITLLFIKHQTATNTLTITLFFIKYHTATNTLTITLLFIKHHTATNMLLNTQHTTYINKHTPQH